jgi:hypothetical protein
LEGLKIGVDGHELNPGNPSLDHPIHGINATAANPHNPNNRLMRLPTPRRLILRLLPSVPRSFNHRFNFPPLPRLLGEDPLQPLGRSLGRAPFARLCGVEIRRLARGWRG